MADKRWEKNVALPPPNEDPALLSCNRMLPIQKRIVLLTAHIPSFVKAGQEIDVHDPRGNRNRPLPPRACRPAMHS